MAFPKKKVFIEEPVAVEPIVAQEEKLRFALSFTRTALFCPLNSYKLTLINSNNKSFKGSWPRMFPYEASMFIRRVAL